ncbi:Vps5 C terminal like-domain-containing protein [Limtongia smithiae]|uniref:Vps5 C terminal like-domain-containing protein n=1 Tax=Limtongia smithiae TaxID=1125753 RepID=UPI0034CFCB08
MDDDLGSSQWDDVATPRKIVSPAASPPMPAEDPATPEAHADHTDLNDTSDHTVEHPAADESTPITIDGAKAAATDKAQDVQPPPLPPKEDPAYVAVPAAALRARALRMARSRKGSSAPAIPAGLIDDETAKAGFAAAAARPTSIMASSVVFEDIDPDTNPLGAVDEATAPATQDATTAALNEAEIGIPSEFRGERGLRSAAISAAATAAVEADPSLRYVPVVATDEYASSVPEGSSSSGVPRHIPVEQAANPTFVISVADPIKVGELTSAHTVYNVRTQTSSKAFKYSDFTVTRRYSDFRWLYHQLSNNNQGIIIPAPPEKQSLGRFDESFVEGRRAAMEKMLNKVAAHPVLQVDPDFKIFLESDTLNSDIKMKEKLAAAQPAEKSGGIFGLSFNGKFVETDESFVDKKHYVEALELQLRVLSRALDTVIIQRKDLADTTAEFGAALAVLGEIELSRSLSSALVGLADVEQRIRDLQERQSLQDMLTLGDTIDEYTRLVESIKTVLLQRQKAYVAWQVAEQELGKKQQYLARAIRQGKTPPERVSAMQEEATEHERKVYMLRVAYDEICKRIKTEFDRFQKEKIEDFRSSVETYLESAVESQKEAIELWETFYERQGFGETQEQSVAQR